MWRRHVALGVGLLLNTAYAAPGGPAYHYEHDELILSLDASSVRTVTLAVQPVDIKGLPSGRKTRIDRQLKAGKNLVSVPVNRAPGHHVSYKDDDVTRRIWASRGAWFTLPRQGFSARGLAQTLGFRSALTDPNDILLARGFRATVQSVEGRRHLTIGKLLNFEEGYGVSASRKQALILVARGNVGPIRLTAAQRVNAKRMQYWDYSLVLSETHQRYVVPLEDFYPREEPRARFTALHSVVVRQFHPSQPKDFIEIDYIALAPNGPRIESTVRREPSVTVRVSKPVPPGATLHVMPRGDLPSAAQSVPIDENAYATIKNPRQDPYWFCYQTPNTGKVCDPPDAPRSSYALPALPDAAILVDDFATRASVNANRLPIITFGSTTPVERDMRVHRVPGSLRVSFEPTSPRDYVGYFTELPDLPSQAKTLELKIRGKVPAESVRIGIRDERNREPKISLRSYLYELTSSWQTVRIPLAAFHAVVASFGGKPRLNQMRRLSVSMGVATTPTNHEFELGGLRFTTDTAPITAARFDAEDEKMSALGSIIVSEARNKAVLTLDRNARGVEGRALSVTVSVTGPKGFALVAIGLGRLDLRSYEKLCFSARGEHGGESGRVYLRDERRRRARVSLFDYVQLTNKWQRVCIPLSAFGRRIALDRLFQLIFAWEDRLISHEKLYLDDIVFE